MEGVGTKVSSPSKSDLKLGCNVNIIDGNLKFENSQDYAQKPELNCTLMNSASGKGPLEVVYLLEAPSPHRLLS